MARMTEIPDPSPEELSALIGAVYDSAFQDPQWKDVLDKLAEMFPGIAATVLTQRGPENLDKVAMAGIEPGTIMPIEEVGPLIARSPQMVAGYADLLAHPDGCMSATRDEMTQQEYEAMPLVQELLRPRGFGHMAMLKLTSNLDRAASFVVLYPGDWAPDDDRAFAVERVLDLLSPHLVRATTMARARRMSQAATEALGGFLDTIILPMVVVSGEGRFLFGNAAGRRFIDRADVVRVDRAGALTLVRDRDTRALRAKLRDLSALQVPTGLRIEDAEGGMLSLAVTPFRPSLAGADAIDRALFDDTQLYAIFIGQRAEDAVSPMLIRDVFGLTRREAEVCADLLVGRSPAEIATRDGRSEKTIRNQVQAVHEKLGVSNQSELIEVMGVFRTVGTLFDQTSSTPETPLFSLEGPDMRLH